MPYKTIELTDTTPVTHQPRKTSQFYKGFSTVDETRIGTGIYDFELIKQDIINHFKTKKGERVMNPAFGSIIWDLIMEPLTNAVTVALKDDIQTICSYDPRVTPIQIDLTQYPQGYVVELTLVLKNTDQSAKMRLTFDQNIGLTVQ